MKNTDIVINKLRELENWILSDKFRSELVDSEHYNKKIANSLINSINSNLVNCINTINNFNLYDQSSRK